MLRRAVSLVLREAVARVYGVELTHQLRRARSWRGWTRRRSTATSRSPATIARTGHGRRGHRLPSTSRLQRDDPKGLDGAPHREQRGLQDVELGRSRARPADATAHARAFARISTASDSRALRQKHLRVAQPADRPLGIEDHGRREDRTGQRTASRFVDAALEEDTLSTRAAARAPARRPRRQSAPVSAQSVGKAREQRFEPRRVTVSS